MKTLQLNRDSWHYKFVNFFDWERESKDFCQYLRRMLAVFIGTSVLSAGVLGLSFIFAVGHIVLYIGLYFKWMTDGLSVFDDIAILGFAFTFIEVVLLTAFLMGKVILPLLGKAINEIPACRDIPLCEDTKKFLIAAYETVHDKTCFKLEFNRDRQDDGWQDQW